MIDTSKRVGSVWPDPPKLQPYKYGRRSEGRFTSVKYSSLSLSEIEAMALQADALGYNYEVEVGFGNKADISIDYNFNSVTSSGVPTETEEADDIWELNYAKYSKQILESSGNALVTACNEAELNELKRRKRDNTLQSLAYFDVSTGKLSRQTYSIGGVATPFSDAAMQLYKMMLDGVDQDDLFGATVTHTKVVGSKYGHPSTFSNVGKIYSTATMVSSEAIPSTVLFGFPSDSDPAPVQIGDLPIYQTYLYGWFKNAPSVRQIANRKWQITQSWDYGLWLINKFGGVRL